MCPIFHVGLRFNFSLSLRVLCTSAPCGITFLLCRDIAEVTVLLEDVSWSQNTNCILFALKNLFCVCESSVRDGCDSAPPTIKPGQVSICTISMTVTQLKQDLLCWDLRVTVTQKKLLGESKPVPPSRTWRLRNPNSSVLFLSLARIRIQSSCRLHIL